MLKLAAALQREQHFKKYDQRQEWHLINKCRTFFLQNCRALTNWKSNWRWSRGIGSFCNFQLIFQLTIPVKILAQHQGHFIFNTVSIKGKQCNTFEKYGISRSCLLLQRAGAKWNSRCWATKQTSPWFFFKLLKYVNKTSDIPLTATHSSLSAQIH